MIFLLNILSWTLDFGIWNFIEQEDAKLNKLLSQTGLLTEKQTNK